MVVGFVGGDVARLHLAASKLKPDASAAEEQAERLRKGGQEAASAVGSADVARAVESAVQAMVKAIGDTATAITHLGGTSATEGTSLGEAAG
jgi:hypothetical protein